MRGAYREYVSTRAKRLTQTGEAYHEPQSQILALDCSPGNQYDI
ncbi:MAG: hypothetical protein ACYC0Q_15225 [Eubacteriales bacterium]